jgi:endo-1,4-beta-D-glucanase Y
MPQRPSSCPAAPEVIADFEEGAGVLVQQGGRTGWWYVFSDTLSGTLTPSASEGPIEASLLPASEQTACNKYAMHSTGRGHSQWVGFGATFVPEGVKKKSIDLAPYEGISFRIKSNEPATPVWFEILTKENQPTEYGGTATHTNADLYNTRGRLLTTVSNTWTTIQVPFGTAAPRYLPAACSGTVLCEAPMLIPTNTLGFQFAVYPQFGTADRFDLWIDDVTLFTGNEAFGTFPQSPQGKYPFPHDAATVGSCAKPSQASGYHLVEMYKLWKNTFVTDDEPSNGLRVKRPENINDSVSEGIAYGLLIAVFMNDRMLFDGLWRYWSHYSIDSTTPLMHFHIDANGAIIGRNSATDADEDAAFALMMAAKQWDESYLGTALSLIKAIYEHDVEPQTHVLKPGSAFGGTTLTNPSYFAPAYYRAFHRIDPNHPWDQVIHSTYTLLENISGPYGLVPAWCSNGCTTAGGSNGLYQDDRRYQYDSHRTSWRIALDYCWNGEPRAQTYADKITEFFAEKHLPGGIGTIADVYELDGTKPPTSKLNSMSIIGCAAVGAMAAKPNQARISFIDRGYQFLLDAAYTPDPKARSGDTTTVYTYYNATVGLLTALTLTGNFTDWQ